MKKDDDPVGFRTLSIDDCGDDSRGIRVMDRRNENMVMVVGRQDVRNKLNKLRSVQVRQCRRQPAIEEL